MRCDPRARRMRITMPRRDPSCLEAIRGFLSAIGAPESEIACEGSRAALTARLGAEEPRYVEDRVESWLHVLDPLGESTLETARGEGPWLDGWRGIYEGVDVPPFRVRPPWDEARPGLHDIVVDPRGGFGSGLHPTTEATLRSMARALAGMAGAALLDVGCGSGVLSVAAGRLGLAPTALDIEPAARLACARSAGENGVPVRVLPGGIEDVAERFPAVVGNLNSDAVRMLAGPIARAVAPGGVLILSGFRPPVAAAVAACYPFGAGALLLSSDGEWAALTLRA